MTNLNLDSTSTSDLDFLFDQELKLVVILSMLEEKKLVVEFEITDADYPVLIES